MRIAGAKSEGVGAALRSAANRMIRPFDESVNGLMVKCRITLVRRSTARCLHICTTRTENELLNERLRRKSRARVGMGVRPVKRRFHSVVVLWQLQARCRVFQPTPANVASAKEYAF